MDGVVIIRSSVEERAFQSETDAAKYFLELMQSNDREISVYKLRDGDKVPAKELRF